MNESRNGRLRSQLALGALALAVGFGVAALPRLLNSDDAEVATAATRGNPRAIPLAPDAPRAATPPLDPPPEPDPADAPAATPGAAVEAFLRAEIQGDFTESYGVLAANDRAAHLSGAGWRAAHAQLPVVLGFTLGATRVLGDRAEIDGSVRFDPELSLTVGLVPSTAVATWVARAEDGGWRVAFSEAVVTPQWLPDTSATAAAGAWVTARTGCGAQARVALLGAGHLVDELCAAHGTTEVGAPLPLEPVESADSFLAAYGPDVFSWARVVPVTAPARVGAVLAPLGSRWRVIGLVDLPTQVLNPQEGATP
jgi:hypothetical protein